MTDIPFVILIFQKGPIEIGHFSLDEFHFVNAEPHLDACCYYISKDDFSTRLIVFGIDTSPPCTPSSNVDIVHFVWQHFEQFNFKKYSVTPLPSEDGSVPKMLYLKYHRTESDGWRDNARCLTCRLDYRRIMRCFTHCTLPANCSCNICVRQPPSLLASGSHIVFNHVFNLEQFELTVDTTYDQYVYALKSNRVVFRNSFLQIFPSSGRYFVSTTKIRNKNYTSSVLAEVRGT